MLITQNKIEEVSNKIDRMSPISHYSETIEKNLTPPKTAKSMVTRKNMKISEIQPPRK